MKLYREESGEGHPLLLLTGLGYAIWSWQLSDFAGDRVRLRHALDVGQRAAELLHGGALGLDEHDRVGHLSVCVPPGSSTTTSEKPAFWTSDLKASASASIGGNVL